MKKIILLAALPLSVAMFSFVAAKNDGTGVTFDGTGEYDIEQPNVVTTSDVQAIAQSVCNIYGIQNQGQTIQTSLIPGKSQLSTFSKWMQINNMDEFATWTDINVPMGQDQASIAQILSTYTQDGN